MKVVIPKTFFVTKTYKKEFPTTENLWDVTCTLCNPSRTLKDGICKERLKKEGGTFTH